MARYAGGYDLSYESIRTRQQLLREERARERLATQARAAAPVRRASPRLELRKLARRIATLATKPASAPLVLLVLLVALLLVSPQLRVRISARLYISIAPSGHVYTVAGLEQQIARDPAAWAGVVSEIFVREAQARTHQTTIARS